MRDADTIVIAPSIQSAARTSWLGYTAHHVITPRTTVRLRGRTLRHIHIVGYYRDDPDLARILHEAEPCTLGPDELHITYH